MMYIVRHSERMDEQFSSEEFEKYIQSKLREGEFNQANPSIPCKRLGLDPVLNAPYEQLYPIYQRRRNTHIYDDPPITVTGVGIAELAGKSLRQLINNRLLETTTSNQKAPVIHVYASRLLRCVQTAYAVAKQLQVDTLYISAGLALTAAAVEQWVREEDNFDHLNMDEICSICHDMIVFDCDHGIVYDNRKHDITVLADTTDNSSNTTAGNHSQQTETIENDLNDALVSDGKTHKYHVCTKNWHTAIQHISDHLHDINRATSANFEETSNMDSNPNTGTIVKVLVAHRETVRNLMIPYQRFRLPYCCIAELMVDTAKSGPVEGKGFALGKLFTPQGEMMVDLTPDYLRISNLSKL